ncbi:MAG: SCO family protein [Hellea sp.]|nr:SCO family protein [Hellea sp.]
MKIPRRLISVLSLSAILFLAACDREPSLEDKPARSGKVTAVGVADIGGPFELVDHTGAPFTDQDLLGKPQLIYFGFAFCPDVCPLALQQMGMALSEIDPDGSYFRPVFISVDPERDTPESLSVYVTNNGFPKGLIGLTGTPEQVSAAKAAYKIYSQKVPDPQSEAGYTVDHASLIYVMDKDGKFVDVFTHDTSTPDIIKALKAYKSEH